MKEALLYEKLENKLAHCYLCNHHCKIAEQKFGICGVRQNIDGILYSHVYARPCTMHVDPIEKKPLYHFFPGSSAFSISTIGCNFRCGFCQNWEISQQSFQGLSPQGRAPRRYPPHHIGVVGTPPSAAGSAPAPPPAGPVPKEEFLPQDVVKDAIRYKCKSISYTYTEPTIFFEYAFDTAKLAKAKGLYNNFVTNGYMTEEALEMIKPYLDAANVDLKFFREESYRKICKAALQPVLNSIRIMRQLNIWVEITTLVVPDENDSEEELRDIAKFIASVDKNIPWHVSRFHPDYQFTDHRPTPEATLKKAQEIGKECGLNYVYIGNVIGFGNDTYCHNCKKLLIKREYFSVLEYNIKEGKCPYCNVVIPGKFG